MVSICRFVFLAVLMAMSAAMPARAEKAAELRTAYILEGKNTNFALYPGPEHRSVAPGEMIHSMEQLVRRVKKLPKGTRIYWTATISENSPALLFEPGMIPEFGKFCKQRGIEFVVSHVVALVPTDQ